MGSGFFYGINETYSTDNTDSILSVFTIGSNEERNAVKLAFQYSSRIEHEIYKPEVEDVEFRLEVGDTVYAGSSFDAAVVVVNKSENTKNIKVNFAAVLSFYTGVPERRLKGYKLQFLLNSNAGKFCQLVRGMAVSKYCKINVKSVTE